jgi:hypothetical protein
MMAKLRNSWDVLLRLRKVDWKQKSWPFSNSGHFIQNDRPDLVIASIRESVLNTQHAF